jgi:hypothetical protein
MKTRLLATLFIISFVGYGQNWNVFNKAYRYNYKFNNSQLISNVLFAESVTMSSADTVYNLNKIGVVIGNALTGDQPQFLQHTVVKKPNGIVKFQSPGAITILPTCSVNQTWLYDSNLNYSATCVSISTVTIFSITDSLRTIVVNNTDSILLSKQFGIIQYPLNYGQNLYYRLVGIEKKATYDLNALYGEKVPNAWDFYDLYVGYQWCYDNEWNYGDPNIPQGCEIASLVVKTRSVTPTGYIYNVDKTFKSSGYYNGCYNPSASPVFTNTNLMYDSSWVVPVGLKSPSLRENYMYPGMVVGPGSPVQLVKLGADNLGRVYKYAGKSCNSLGLIMPNQNEPVGYIPSGPPNTYTVGTMLYSVSFGVGKGKLTDDLDCLCQFRYCTTCYGTVGTLGKGENKIPWMVYPNPAITQLNLPIDRGTVKLFDCFGKLIKEQILDKENTLDISAFQSGLYFIEIQSDSFKSTQKLIIQH